jgi:hypothetical protein
MRVRTYLIRQNRFFEYLKLGMTACARTPHSRQCDSGRWIRQRRDHDFNAGTAFQTKRNRVKVSIRTRGVLRKVKALACPLLDKRSIVLIARACKCLAVCVRGFANVGVFARQCRVATVHARAQVN